MLYAASNYKVYPEVTHWDAKQLSGCRGLSCQTMTAPASSRVAHRLWLSRAEILMMHATCASSCRSTRACAGRCLGGSTEPAHPRQCNTPLTVLQEIHTSCETQHCLFELRRHHSAVLTLQEMDLIMHNMNLDGCPVTLPSHWS